MSGRFRFVLTAVLVTAVVMAAGAGGALAARVLGLAAAPAAVDAPLGTGFTYQGQLKNGSVPVNGTCDLQVSLWDAVTGGTQLGATQTLNAATVLNGLFTVQLNGAGQFGPNAFNGQARWLQIAVRCPAGSGTYTTLNPRQALTATPYALYAATAGTVAYQNVIVVAKSGGNFSAIQPALDSITTNGPENRYLLWVAPGTYTETITMKPYVDIHGAGQDLTKITASGFVTFTTGTVVGADNAELSALTVENTGNSSYAIAIYNNNASPRLTDLTVSAMLGHAWAVYNTSSSPVMHHMIINAQASAYTLSFAVFNENSSPEMTDLVINASGGPESENHGVLNVNSSPLMRHIFTSASSGEYAYGVANESNSAPQMFDIIARASSAEFNVGIGSKDSSPILSNVAITTTGGVVAWGLANYTSTVRLDHVNVNVLGSANPIGILNDSSSASIDYSYLGGGSGYGIDNVPTGGGSYVVTVNFSRVVGALNTIRNATGFDVSVGASQLAGGNVGAGGVIRCVGAYDENYTSPGYSICP
jgi:hypothetical protein